MVKKKRSKQVVMIEGIPSSPSMMMMIPQTKATTKNVTFRCRAADGSINPCVTVKSFTPRVLEPQDIQTLWYSAEDYRRFELDAHEMTIFCLTTNGRYQTALEELLSACIIDSNGSAMAWHMELANNKKKQQQKRTVSRKRSSSSRASSSSSSSPLTFDQALRLGAADTVRGLERLVLRQLALQQSSCRLYVQRTLDGSVAACLECYKKWRRDPNLTDCQKATVVAQHMRNSSSSQLSQSFAQLLARGDAMLVRQYQNRSTDFWGSHNDYHRQQDNDYNRQQHSDFHRQQPQQPPPFLATDLATNSSVDYYVADDTADDDDDDEGDACPSPSRSVMDTFLFDEESNTATAEADFRKSQLLLSSPIMLNGEIIANY